MNERIRELWRQAVLNNTKTPMNFQDAADEFAKLVVRECMDIAHNVGNISEPDDWALDRCYEIEQRIQDRFGVEE